jgi:hypothetical protein
MSNNPASVMTSATSNPCFWIDDQPHLEALLTDSGLEPSERRQLVACARASGATRRQLPGVLRQARFRLLRLRDTMSRGLAVGPT